MIYSLSNGNKISNKLQQDIIKIAGKTIFINPFLYWRKIDENTNKWLRETGQISKEKIQLNRNRFYPELDWSTLSDEDKYIKEGTIELFLKTLELIRTFHPSLNASQMFQVETKLSLTKKYAFERCIKKSFIKKEKNVLKERKKFQRYRFFSDWYAWFSLGQTQKALLPILFIMFFSVFVGWFAGISKNSCNPYFENTIMNNTYKMIGILI